MRRHHLFDDLPGGGGDPFEQGIQRLSGFGLGKTEGIDGDHQTPGHGFADGFGQQHFGDAAEGLAVAGKPARGIAARRLHHHAAEVEAAVSGADAV